VLSESKIAYNRIIGVLTLNFSILTRTHGFVPDYPYTDCFIDSRYFDEIVIVKVDNSTSERDVNLYRDAVERLMRKVALPLTLGGSITTFNDACLRFEWGADRILLGETMLGQTKEVKRLISLFGSQALIACINYYSSKLELSDSYRKKTVNTALRYQDMGVGEILFSAIDKDGNLQGMDNFLARQLESTPIGLPVVLNGGLGNWLHIEEAFESKKISGVCTSNILHLTTTSVRSMKQALISRGGKFRSNWQSEAGALH